MNAQNRKIINLVKIIKARCPYVSKAISGLSEGTDKNLIKSHLIDAAILTALQGKHSLDQQMEINKLKEQIKKDKGYIAKLVVINSEEEND